MSIETRYQILEKIGAGSFATVYRARDTELGREVAIKQLHSEFLADPGQLDRFWREAQLLASLQHPNIVTIFDIVRDRGWLVMELMQSNLTARLSGRQVDLRALRATLAGRQGHKHGCGQPYGPLCLSGLLRGSGTRYKPRKRGLLPEAEGGVGRLQRQHQELPVHQRPQTWTRDGSGKVHARHVG